MALENNTQPFISKGTAQNMENINPSAFIARRKEKSVEEIVKGIQEKDRVMLGQAITLIESTRPEHQAKAQAIVEACLPLSGNALRIGITGSPGVGKSTFIEQFGQFLIEKGHYLAVLAIDPSSQVSKGSILGDKTRMEYLSANSAAFIRPSPAGEALGGVAKKTRETITLCEAAGYDIILVETVGVGQSEIAVHSMTDFFLLLLLPGAGDELQGIKRGVVEMADLIAINKADENRLMLAKQAQAAYRNALHLFPPKDSAWIPPVLTCSALQMLGLDKIFEQLNAYKKLTQENGFFEKNRQSQAKYWLNESIFAALKADFEQHPLVKAQLQKSIHEVNECKVSPFKAANDLINLYKTRD